MHPRVALKDEIKGILVAELPGVPVYASLIGEVDPSHEVAVIVYVTDETLVRAAGRRTGLPDAPVSRNINVDIVATRLSTADTPASEELASDEVNDLARRISRAINSSHVTLSPVSERQEFNIGEQVRVATVMTFTSTINDTMEA